MCGTDEETAMKKVLVAIVLPLMALSLGFFAAGQTSAGSLNEQMMEAVEKGDFAAVAQLLDKMASRRSLPQRQWAKLTL
jgi:uncharacterized membrane protein YvbJ